MATLDDIGGVGSLFGLTPASLNAQREQQYIDFASKVANAEAIRPGAGSVLGANVMGARGVEQLGSMFGIESPEQKLAKLRQAASQQFDTTNPEGLMQVAQFLNQQGDAAGARQAVMAAEAQKQKLATLEKTESEAAKNLREKAMPTSPLGKLLYEKAQLIKGGAAPNDPDVLAYDKAIAAEGKGKGNVEVNLGGVFDKMFTKKEAEDQAETWNKAGQAYAEASKLGRSVREMEAVVGNAFTGSYGSLKAGVSRALGGGKKLEDTEVLDALSAQLVLPLAKLLPGSLAVKELDQLIKTKPNLSQQEATIRRLLGTISQDLKASEITYEAGEKYRAANQGSIKGFNPYITNNKATRLAELEGMYAKNGKLTDTQKKEAQALIKELQVEAK
jgi:hypothetical protein